MVFPLFQVHCCEWQLLIKYLKLLFKVCCNWFPIFWFKKIVKTRQGELFSFCLPPFFSFLKHTWSPTLLHPLLPLTHKISLMATPLSVRGSPSFLHLSSIPQSPFTLVIEERNKCSLLILVSLYQWI